MNALQDWAIRWRIPLEAWNELAQLYMPTVEAFGEYTETGLNAMLRITSAQHGAILWRNNSGALLDETGRLVRYGLGNDSKRINEVIKSSDLIGITPVEWQGRVFGVFTAIESKAPSWHFSGEAREIAQRNYLTKVESLGGIGTFARTIDDYLIRIGRK